MSAPVGAMLRSRKRNANAVLSTERFRSQVELLAERLKRPLDEVIKEASEGMHEIATVQHPAFAMMFDHGLGPMHTRAWTIDVDQEGLRKLKRLNQEHSLVFLPTHRSYADAFILTRTLREAGMPRNHILGGNNVGFFPLGTIIRRSGGVLVRRSFQDDEVYKFVVREYLGYLAAQGHNLEWYMEGGRSRTGKLRPPKYGLLRYLVDAVESGVADDMLLVPVAITYDQLHEVGVMAAEEAGAQKAKEGLRWLADYARMQQKWIGTAYVRFGETLSLKEGLGRADDEDGGRWTVEKIAFEVFSRINRVLPLHAYAEQRGLPTATLDVLKTENGLGDVLAALAKSGVVRRYAKGVEPVYGINPGQHLVAAFYRNSAIHWFVNRAITELAWSMELDTPAADPLPAAWERSFALRDLLKFDFFFSDRETFRDEIKAEMRLLDPRFRARAADRGTRHDTLLEAPFLVAHRALTAFIEAYYVVADRLAAHPVDAPVDKAAFLAECVNVGRQYLMQRRLQSPECISKELFGNAILLASNRNLLKPGDDKLAARRAAFAQELTALVAAVGAIDALDQQRMPARLGAAA